jgi:hypothetical protein
VHFLEWVRQHPEMQASDLKGLKEALKIERKHAREAVIIARK